MVNFYSTQTHMAQKHHAFKNCLGVNQCIANTFVILCKIRMEKIKVGHNTTNFYFDLKFIELYFNSLTPFYCNNNKLVQWKSYISHI